MNLFSGIAYLFHIIFYQPLLNALILLYVFVAGRDFGVAIILLTIFIRLLLYPLMAESIRVQKVTNELQPKIKEIQEKYKHNKEQQATLHLQLLKDHNVNLFNSFFATLIQLPILVALYQVFINGLHAGVLVQLYSFVPNPDAIDPVFLHIIDLSKPNVGLVLAAGILQFFQSKMFYPAPGTSGGTGQSKTSPMPSAMQKQILYVLPVATVLIFWNFPAALSLYWVITSACAIVQQKIIFKKLALMTK